MKITILKENKNDSRVFVIPADIKRLVQHKHDVYIVKDVGKLAGYSDQAYIENGAKILPVNRAIIQADIILKIATLKTRELRLIKPHQFVISLFNLANQPKLLKQLLQRNITTIGIEAIHHNQQYPFLIPNEEIKGRFGVNLAIYHLAKLDNTHLGKSFSPITHNLDSAKVVVLNASYAGYEAVRYALALGCSVTLLENDEGTIKQMTNNPTLATLASIYHSTFDVLKATFVELEKQITKADVFINTNGIPGSLTAIRITEKMISTMHKGAIYVNLAADQGLASETEHKISNINKLTHIFNDVIHFNMPNISTLFPVSISTSISHMISDILISNSQQTNALA
jgi:alanine dehydrogenase